MTENGIIWDYYNCKKIQRNWRNDVTRKKVQKSDKNENGWEGIQTTIKEIMVVCNIYLCDKNIKMKGNLNLMQNHI